MPATRKPNSIVYTKAVRALRSHSNPERAKVYRWYFKDPGQDVFLGVSTKDMRRVARDFRELPVPDVRRLVRSRVHEERSLAHAILRWKFERGAEAERERIFRFYLRHRRFIHTWDGVDDSAPYIVGPWLLDRDKSLLYQLARSPRLWDRRIAMVSTLHFIRNGHLTDTLKLAEALLHDKEDLIHKACGWTLREAGKKDLAALKRFLRRHYKTMPRTMLRYAIEKFPEAERQRYLKGRI
ncbi:MAG TPA: DNA alkylation repair protein [Candidatus Angelobacter sp.]